jgi:hypothetical protein
MWSRVYELHEPTLLSHQKMRRVRAATVPTMSTSRPDRFFKFDSDGPVEVTRDKAVYGVLGEVRDGVTRVEYVDGPESYHVHVNSHAPSWDWDRLTQILNADQP